MATCTLMTYEEAAKLAHMDSVVRESRRLMAHARATRTCVWCEEPIAEHRVYPACEDCREYRGVEKP